MNINTTKSRCCCILISWSAYAIMPVGKKDMTMFHVNKERTLVCTTNTCEGSSLFISVVEHPPGYLLSLLCLSNHLQMRWQVTPAATVTIKVIKVFITLTSSRCRVSVGQHCKYIISLVILEVQTVLRNYQASRNFLFLSNKKSWWRELNPYSLPLECRKIKAFQTFSLSNFE